MVRSSLIKGALCKNFSWRRSKFTTSTWMNNAVASSALMFLKQTSRVRWAFKNWDRSGLTWTPNKISIRVWSGYLSAHLVFILSRWPRSNYLHFIRHHGGCKCHPISIPEMSPIICVCVCVCVCLCVCVSVCICAGQENKNVAGGTFTRWPQVLQCTAYWHLIEHQTASVMNDEYWFQVLWDHTKWQVADWL